MDNSQLQSTRLDDLRARAEAVLSEDAPQMPETSTADIQRLIYELQTHEIELEMQNEELRRTQEELIESRDRYADLYNFAPIGYLTLSQKNIICRANLTAAEMLGVGRSRLLNSPLSSFILKEDQDIYYQLRRKVLESKESQSCELRMRGSAGPFWARIESTLTEVDDGSCLHLQVVINDITDIKETAERESSLRADLAHMARLTTMGEMAGELAHELNQPLAAVTMLAEVINRLVKSDSDLNEDKLIRSCENLVAQAMRAGELVRRMRSFATRAKPSASNVEFGQILDNAILLAKAEFLNADIKITADLEDSLPMVSADGLQVEQVLLNVMRNSLEAMRESDFDMHELRIRATRYRNGILVTIRDTGPGLPEDELDNLFGTFYTTKPEGMGLGLSICRSIIEAHGGRMWAASNPDRGATFSFTLPAAEEHKAPRRESQAGRVG